MKTKIGTIARITALIVALINMVLAFFGESLPFTENTAYKVVSVVLLVVSALYAAWKNNDFTRLAKLVGALFDALKDGKITEDEVKNLLDNPKVDTEQEKITYVDVKNKSENGVDDGENKSSLT